MTTMRTRSIAAGAAMTLALGGLAAGYTTATATTASAETITPTTTAVFNDPTDSVDRWKVRDHIVNLIDSADTGSRIDVAMYVFADDTVAQALVRADAERDVHVRVVVDHYTSTWDTNDRPGYNRLKSTFGNFTQMSLAERRASSWLRTCTAKMACISSAIDDYAPRNHNKFFLFSSVGGKKVVVNSSANLTTSSQWNNAVTLVDDDALYTHYATYFNELAHSRNNRNDVYSEFGGTGDVSSSKVWFFPRATPSSGNQSANDTIGDILANTTCTSSTKIKIGMRNFGDADSTSTVKARLRIANELVDCAQAGATVEIVYTSMQAAFENAVDDHPRISLYQVTKADSDTTVHSKYMLIDGTFAGTAGKWIFTGSHNYDLDSLRDNDENLMRLNDASIYSQYAANIETMKPYATPM